MFEMEVKQNCRNCYWWGDEMRKSKKGKAVRGLCQCYDKDTSENCSCIRWRNKDNYKEKTRPFRA